MLSTSIKTVGDIERLLLQTVPGVEVHIRANLEGRVIVDVYCEGRLWAHQSAETLAGAVEMAFGTETVWRVLRDARPYIKTGNGYICGERWSDEKRIVEHENRQLTKSTPTPAKSATEVEARLWSFVKSAREAVVGGEFAKEVSAKIERALSELDRESSEGECHSQVSDGDCNWPGCPQLRDGEPERSGRDCPLLELHGERWVAQPDLKSAGDDEKKNR